MMESELKTAIKRTIAYGKNFGVGYNIEDVRERLISNEIFKDEEIEKELEKLKIRNYVSRVKRRNKKIDKARKLAEFAGRYFKDILMIGVTGSVAAGYPKKNDDIDLMVITKKDRLWLTRLGLRIFIWINKIPHRKYGGRENEDEFCFNLWLEEEALELPKDRMSLRNAMDSILMMPVLNRQSTYERFMRENGWIKKYLINTYTKVIRHSVLQPSFYNGRKSTFLNILNYLFFWPQYWYMKKKIGNGLVDLRRAFFHP